MDGWIKLHRRIRGNPVFNDLHLLRLWVICLTEATHKERDQIIGKQVVHLMPGEFVTGRFDLHGMFNNGLKPKDRVTEYTVWRWLLTLQELEFLSIKSSNKFSVVTVVKWLEYQSQEHENEQQMSNKRATNEQQMSTNKNVKNEKNEKNDKKVKEYRPETAQLTDHFIFWIKRNNENSKIPPNLDKWNDEMDKLERIDNYEYMQIRSAIDWCQQDSFWKSNILSVPKLREKIGTIVMQMQRKSPSGNGKVTAFTKIQQMYQEEVEKEREASGNY